MYRLLFVLLTAFSLVTYAQHSESPEYLTEIGEVVTVHSEVLGEDRAVYAAFPIGYDSEGDRKYPVVYLLDGETHLPALVSVQEYYSGGFTPDMILVGIRTAENRDRDLTSGRDTFLDFIEKELIPQIEKEFPVTDYRTLIGHSFGGLFTISAMIERPELFTNYLAIDPSLQWGDRVVLNRAVEALEKEDFEGKSLFASLGGQLHMADPTVTLENVMEDSTFYTDFARANVVFEQAASTSPSGLEFFWKFYPRDLHGTIVFPSLMDGMIELFAWFQMEDTYRINDFSTPRDTLYEIVKRREQKLKDHFGYFEAPYPEELLNVSGYMNMEMGQMDKAQMYFEFALEYYPDSPNVYDSYADYWLQQGDEKKAIAQLKKAVSLSDAPYYAERLAELQGQ